MKASNQVGLAFIQRLAGDTTGAKEPDNFFGPASLSQAYAAMGKKDSALELAQRAIMLGPRAKDPVSGPSHEENLAVIQTMFGENRHAISTLTQLSQTPYMSWFYGPPVTPALLRLDPLWDPLRADPAFQKLYEHKKP
jgi:hypothetical protein